MSVRTILTYPNPELLKPSQPVTEFDESLKILAQDMLETMRANNGIGLAAPQIGIHLKLIVMEIPETLPSGEEQLTQLILCNPRLTQQKGHVAIEEGCLSLPEFYIEVDRSERIVLEAEDLEGKTFTREETGLMAICIQHEMDHLKGRLLVDYADKADRQTYKKERQKIQNGLQ